MAYCAGIKEEVDDEEDPNEEETEHKVEVDLGGEGMSNLELKPTRGAFQKGKVLAKNLTPEEKREIARQRTARRRELRAVKETPEQRAKRLQKDVEYRKRKRREETPEEKQKRLQKERERRRQLRQEETPEEKERRAQKKREWRKKKAPEEAAEYRQKNKERMRQVTEKERRLLNKVPETEEEKKKREEMEEKRRQREFNKLVKKATMTEEEKEAERMKKFLYKQAWEARRGRWRDQPKEMKEKARRQNREWVANLEGERKERWKESYRRAHKKYLERLKNEAVDKWQSLKEGQLEYQRRRYANETPDERRKRRWKDKVNGARRKLKMKLGEEGVEEEEIERRCEELKVAMWREFDPDMEVPSIHTRGNRRKRQQPVISLSKEVVASCSEPGGKNGQVGKEDDNQCSPPPSPDAAPSPVLSECQEALDPVPGQMSPEEDPPTSSRETKKCSHCPSEFPDDIQLRSHTVCSHSSKCWKCPKCKEVVMSPLELSQHYNAVHKIPKEPPPSSTAKKEVYKFMCICCSSNGNQFKTGLELFSHVKSKHSTSFWPCDHCNLLKYSQQSLHLHLQICRRHQMKKSPS